MSDTTPTRMDAHAMLDRIAADAVELDRLREDAARLIVELANPLQFGYRFGYQSHPHHHGGRMTRGTRTTLGVALAGCVNKVQPDPRADRAWRRIAGALVAVDDTARGVTCYALYVYSANNLSCLRTFAPRPEGRP